MAEQCGLGFAKTIFWGKGFGKTSTDLDFASGGGGVWGGILRLLHPFSFGEIRGEHPCYSISYHCDILYLCDILWIMQDESTKLGLNLKRIRTKKGISQGDIARDLEVSRGFISTIENGKTNPTLATIAKLAKAVGVSVNELLK